MKKNSVAPSAPSPSRSPSRSQSCRAAVAALAILVGAPLLSAPADAAPAEFDAPVRLTPTGGVAREQLAQNPARSALWEGERLHVVSWIGGFATSLADPSAILHREWTEAGGWSEATVVDDSFDAAERRLGGRHPTLLLDDDGALWVAWHDYRHTNTDSPGNGIDNVEIYADVRPAGGAFTGTDFRLTATTAAHLGDNGYVARLFHDPQPDGERAVGVAWYDFHADADASDIYLRRALRAGELAPATDLAPLRRTFAADRGPSPPSFTMADAVADAAGRIHVVWTTGTGGEAPVLHAVVGGDGNGPLGHPPTTLHETGRGFFDPPRLARGPDGRVWIAATVREGSALDVALFAQDTAGDGTTFTGGRLGLAPTVGATAPDLAFGPDGELYLAWVEGGAPGSNPAFGRYDRTTGEVVDQVVVTTSGFYLSVALAISPEGRVGLLGYRDVIGTGRSVWVMHGRLGLAPAGARTGVIVR